MQNDSWVPSLGITVHEVSSPNAAPIGHQNPSKDCSELGSYGIFQLIDSLPKDNARPRREGKRGCKWAPGYCSRVA